MAAVSLLAPAGARAGEFDFRGQLSAWATLTDADPEAQIGARYIPEISLSIELPEEWELNAEAAANIHGYQFLGDGRDSESDADLDLYRLWLRLATPQFEARAGLQKISFGSATLLRPLMWFDTLDPRDPLQLTDGVYGLLARYTFLNNANIWAWGLYGNDDLRGWETVPTDRNDPEWGGRAQLPLGPGEIGVSYHHRRADPAGTVLAMANPGQGVFPEDRLGLDGKWDVVVGVWFEGVVTRQELDAPDSRYQKQLTVGSDYTFGVGNGLHVLAEHLVSEIASDVFGGGESASISAATCDYPLGLFDTVAAFVYYDWEGGTWSPMLQWRRTYDQWQIHVSAFRSEGETPSAATRPHAGPAGDGVRLMLVFNH